MEKTWDEFWQTGKVTDYLSYCSKKEREERKQKEEACYGTVRCTDRNGSDRHACW